jgi:hypothetical protein
LSAQRNETLDVEVGPLGESRDTHKVLWHTPNGRVLDRDLVSKINQDNLKKGGKGLFTERMG